MNELIEKVINWAEDRNIIDGSTTAKQLEKTAAEFTELCIAVGQNDRAGVQDGIGDVLVTLIVVATQNGLHLDNCLLAAYEQIKDRKGRMVNGIFVKEADL